MSELSESSWSLAMFQQSVCTFLLSTAEMSVASVGDCTFVSGTRSFVPCSRAQSTSDRTTLMNLMILRSYSIEGYWWWWWWWWWWSWWSWWSYHDGDCDCEWEWDDLGFLLLVTSVYLQQWPHTLASMRGCPKPCASSKDWTQTYHISALSFASVWIKGYCNWACNKNTRTAWLHSRLTFIPGVHLQWYRHRGIFLKK